jgi:short-subunit dehydrogenase
VSSVFGLVAIPSQSAYNAAKFAVRAFTDALRMELEIEDCGVSATTALPGGIRTNIARNARVDESVAGFGAADEGATEFDRLARTSPEKAARRILAGVAQDRRRVLVGPDAVALDLVSRLPTSWYQRVLEAAARRRRRRT